MFKFEGLPIFNKEFLKIENDFAFLKVISSLLYSTLVYEKKEYLNKSILHCLNLILVSSVIYTISGRNNIE